MKITDNRKAANVSEPIYLNKIPGGQAFYGRFYDSSVPEALYLKISQFTVVCLTSLNHYNDPNYEYPFYDYRPVNIEIVVTEGK